MILILALASVLDAQAASQSLTNDDVISMFRGGVEESTIDQRHPVAGYNCH
jgi:hypothetical protein